MKLYFLSTFPLSLIFIFTGSVFFSGCYTIKQGTTYIGYLSRAIPLDELASKDTPEEAAEGNRLFVNHVEDIRRFAIEVLGLKDSKNYTRYVELDRNYLAAIVSASQMDSFTRHEWWFPVVGRMPYKGFFNIEDARKERTRLERRNLDVWIRGVDAFSTLGWFKDPLFSFMKDYPLIELADLIIHELLHATVFLKNQTQFNEELAAFVGQEGARLYMEIYNAREGVDESLDQEEAEARRADNAFFLAFIQDLIAELEQIYNSQDLSREEKINKREIIIASAQKNFEENYEDNFQTENYRNFSSMQINNAYLDLYRLYYERSTWFKDLYEKSGSDLKAFIDAAKTLTGRENPWIEFETALNNVSRETK